MAKAVLTTKIDPSYDRRLLLLIIDDYLLCSLCDIHILSIQLWIHT